MDDHNSGLSGPIWADTPVLFEKTLDGTLGCEVLSLTDELARGRVRVTDRVRQMWGLVHGGVYAALAEMLASEATVSAVHGAGRSQLGSEPHELPPPRYGGHGPRRGEEAAPRQDNVAVGGLPRGRRGQAVRRLEGHPDGTPSPIKPRGC